MNSSALGKSGCAAVLRRSARLQALVISLLAPGLVMTTSPVMANPRGGVVVHGDVSIGAGHGGNLQIRQGSRSAIIDWESFSIESGELTQFRQSGSNAAVLNRVTGGDASAIHGALKANGNVFVINPNGILVGAGGTIDVHGLVLSTLDVDNGEFLARGDLVFKGGSGAGVTNLGRVNAIGGDVFLIGRTVVNSGTLRSEGGRVGLAAGEEVLLKADDGVGGERLFVRATGSGVSGTGIYNDGTIEGAAVELKAHGNLYALAINNKGSVRATGAERSGGRVYLRGVGGSVSNSGSIRASSSGVGSGGRVLIEAAYAKVDGMIRAQGGEVRISAREKAEVVGKVDVSNGVGHGGSVVVEGREIELRSGSLVDASGHTGGGNVRIGGGFQGRDAEVRNAESVLIDDGAVLRADALSSGRGGNVIVWSDGDTVFEGGLSARGITGGGFAEVSGKSTLEVGGDIDLTASAGAAGTLLLDPTNITISATGAGSLGGSTISNVWLSQQLDAGNNVVISTNFGSGGAGHITVGRTDTNGNAQADRIQWYQDSVATSGGTLTFLAQGNIYFNTAVQSAGHGGVNVVAGWDGITGWSGAGSGGTGPITFDMAAVLATMPGGSQEGMADAAGLNGGSVFLGATNARHGVSVGSRWGNTNLAAHDLVLRGSTTIGRGWAQLGFNDNGVEYQLSTSHNGAVLNEWWGAAAGNVQGKNYIALLGGTEFGTGDTLSLGTRAFRGAGWGATGDIAAALSGRVDARGGTTASYTQIGHGGILSDGTETKWLTGQAARVTRDGIQISPELNRYSVFASTWRTNYAGAAARIDADIKVIAAEDILIMGAPGFDGVTDMQSTSVVDSVYTMIGHGGAENQGSYHGNISVEARGATSAATSAADNNGLAGLGIQVLGGRGTRSFAMIGHGSGYESNPRSIWDQTMSGDIAVRATTGAIRVQGHNQAVRATGSNLNTGAVIGYDEVISAGNASDASNLGSFVQIGHGGQVGTLQVAGGIFIMPGGVNVNNIAPDTSMSGNIEVFAGGTYLDPENADTPIGILVRAGNRRWYHAMVGHGGTNWNAINTAVQTPNFGGSANLPFGAQSLAASTGYNGNIRVEADRGSVIATGGDAFRPDRIWGYGLNYVHVGHGGDTARGNKEGAITVLAGQGVGATAGDILFTAGQMVRDHAMLGHGGYDADGNITGAANSAKITATAYGDIRFVSPQTIAQLDALRYSVDYANWFFSGGSGGTFGTTDATLGGMYNVNDRFVQLGHGGRSNTTAIANRQDIEVTSGTGDLKNADGDASTGGIAFVAGDMDRNYAQLGHGGWQNGAIGTILGDIVVKAHGGTIVFDATVLGGQNTRHQTDRSLNGIAVTRVIQGYGGGTDAYAMLGHGGSGGDTTNNTRGVYNGNIDIDTWGGIGFFGAAAAPKVDRLVTNAAIDAAINAGTNVWVPLANLTDTAANVAQEYWMPELISNIVPGTLRIVLSDGSVLTDLPNNGSDDRQSGLYRNGVKVGDVHYDWGLVRFDATLKTASGGTWGGTGAEAAFQTAQGLKDRAFVQLGHGGYDADGPNNKANDLLTGFGDITIHAGGDIRFEGGAGHRNFAQLGHGGYETKGASGGNITIDHIDVSNPLGRVGGIRFLAGHGGHRQFDYHSYAQLGHGGVEADGNHFGNIYIRGTEDADGMGLFFKAGDRQDASVLLGHGGLNARTGIAITTPAVVRTYHGLNGDIDIEVTGDVAFVAGTMTMNNPLYRDDGRLFAQLGHGGYDADATNDNTVFFGQTRTNPALPVGTLGAGDGNWGHFGDITLVSTNGHISFMGGSNIPVMDRFDLGGNPLPLPADPNGFLTGRGDGKGRMHWAQVGHGGYASSGDHYGNISVSAPNGGVHLVGGMLTNDDAAEKHNWSQIGHGGGEAQGHLGRTTETIRVRAGGDVVVAAGQGNRNQAHIGNGGNNFDGTHTGTIQVYAGGDIHLRGGMALERVVRRIGEFQDMTGADGGAANDLSEFNAYYGSGGLGYLMMDAAAAAGNGQKTKLIGKEIQPGTVEFRLAEGAALFNAAKTAEYIDDGNGNIVQTSDPSNIVGTIDYATGEIVWTTAILASNTANQPDLFVDYDHRTGIRNDALYANATIGHGGYASGSRVEAHPEAANGFVNRGIVGNIDVRAGVSEAGAFNGSGGSIVALAGNDQRTYVQIGHGGMDSGTPAGHAFSGRVDVRADGDIDFRGGGGLVDNQHIAFNYYGTGSSTVTAVTTASDLDRTNPRYATPLGAGTQSMSGISDIVYAFAHIGHGGVSSHANNGVDNNLNNPLAATNDPTTGHNGSISVRTAAGDILFTGGGDGGHHFAQIGHGGTSSLGNHFGDIEVLSGRDIVFTGGGASYRGTTNADKGNYVQIGHGGRSLTGNLSGAIDVSSAGAIRFSGGDGLSDRARVPYSAHVYVLNRAADQDENHYNRSESRQNPAQIGHGGFFVYGDKTGDIFVTAGAGIDFRGGDRLAGSLDNNAGYLNYAQIGHGGVQAWRQIRTNLNLPNAGATVAPNADDWNLPIRWDPVNNRYVLDGTGQFPWPTDNSIDPVLGLGNPLYDGFSGDITVTAVGGDIRFSGGTAPGAFGQLGHGGMESGGDHNGDIKVEARNGNIVFSANRIEETGSTATSSNTYVQIGHGGSFSSGEQSGRIDVRASGEIRFKGGRNDAYAMVGHGGREEHSTGTTQWGSNYRHSMNWFYSRNTMYRPGTRSGDISVTAGGDIAFSGGNLNGYRAFAQIGHGGYRVHANPDPNSQFGDGHNGLIEVVSTGGGIVFTGGQGTYSHAQIGHGGVQSFGNHGGDGNDNRSDSDILVQAVTGIDMIATGRASTALDVARNYAQIGHGGWQSSFRPIAEFDSNAYAKLQPLAGYTNPETGAVNVDNPGAHPLTPFTVGTTTADPVNHYLGSVMATLGTFKGDITVRTTGAGADIRFIGPNTDDGTFGVRAQESYVQLGHGGYANYGAIDGTITVESAGDLVFRSGGDITTWSQLGHGGRESTGAGTGANAVGFSGDIAVTTAGDILFVAGTIGGRDIWDNNGGGNYTQLGHGGYNADVDSTRANVTGLLGPDGRPVGHHGSITVLSGGSVEFLAGDANRAYESSFGDNYGTLHYAQLGHGGYHSYGNHYGDITVRAGIDADLAVTNPNARIYFAGGSDTTSQWADTNNYAQLGHGGREVFGNHGRRSGAGVGATALETIKVYSGGDIVFTAAGGGVNSYAQLGNGGYQARGDHAADIDVYAKGGTLFEGAVALLDSPVYGQYSWAGTDANAQTRSLDWAANLHTGVTNPGLINGVTGRVNINYRSVANGSIRITIRDTSLAVIGRLVQMGNYLVAESNITANFGAGVETILAGTPVAAIGNGGLLDNGASSQGTTYITFLRDVNPGANDGTANLAIEFLHGAADRAYAQLGHGGYDADNPNGGTTGASRLGNLGNITVRASEDVVLKGGDGAAAYAQIGHGGYGTSGRDVGTISVGTAANRIGGGVVMLGGHGDYYAAGDAYVQIGHGGRAATGTKSGDISIYATRAGLAGYEGAGLHLQAGSRNNAYALVGHGGTEARSGTGTDIVGTEGNIGDITIDVVGDVNAIAGVLDRGGSTNAQSLDDGNLYAQIGHGGYNADTMLADSLTTIHTGGATTGHRGNIVVISREGSVNVLAGDHLRDFLPSFGPAARNYGGDGLGDFTLLGPIAGGRHHYAMIGHGGMYVYGNHWGSIDVRAGFNDAAVPGQTGTAADSFVRLWGGRAVADQDDGISFAMIGNGGRSAVGNQGRAGDTISVRAVGDVEVHAGRGIDAFAHVGNGGAFSRGDHHADILVSAGRNLSARGSQVSSAQPLVTRYAHVSTANASELNQNTDRAGLVQPVAGGNPAGRLTLRAVNGVIPGSVWIEVFNDAGVRIGTIEDDGASTLRVVADFTELVDGVQLVAGQSVGTVNYPANWLEFDTRVNPGTEAGAINVVVNLQHLGSNRAYAQIGNGGYDADNPDGTTSVGTTMYNSAITNGNSGNIDIFAGGDVILRGGANGQAYAQFGHGGMYNTGRNVGNITLGTSANRIGGGVIMQGGAGEYYDTKSAYVQIGHGGWTAYGTQTGNIDIHANSGLAAEYAGIGLQVMAGTREDNYAQVGHGGFQARSGSGTGAAGMEGHSGNITVDVVGDVNVVSGVLDRGGATLAQFVDDGRLSAQIGHGGYDSDATLDGATSYNTIGHNGAIKVISQQGSVNVLAGDHLRDILPSLAPTPGIYASYDYFGAKRMEAIAGGRFHWAMIGHGGYESRGNHYGDITVHAGFNDAAVQTGTTAGSHVRVWGGRYVSDQDASQQFSQIGHGGRTGIGNQGRDGEVISVMAAGDVQVHGGDGYNNYAQIGNGGYEARGDHKGDVQVFAGRNVSVLASQFDRNQTLGNGLSVAYHYPSVGNADQLNINLDRAGLLQTVPGSTYLAGQAAFSGVSSANFILGSLAFDIYTDAGVYIGTIADADGSGILRVVADFTEQVGGAWLVAGQQVGTVNYAGNRVQFTTRVNPGAPGAGSSVGGEAVVSGADPNPNIVARFEHVATERSYAMIGHGGYDADNPNDDTSLGNSGNIFVTALGNIVGRGGTSLDSYVHFGHGGRSTKGGNTGDVVLRAGGDVELTARGQQGQNRAYVQVGHGGYEGDGNHSGNVIVSAGSGALNTLLGTGLFDDLGDFDRDGSPDAIQFAPVGAGQGSVTLTGGTFNESWVQIGHGGYVSGNTAGNASTMTGHVGVAANGDITLQGGSFSAATGTTSATGAYTQIGHGGLENNLNMTLSGDISVVSQTGRLSVLAGNGSEAYALVGHGSLRNTLTNVPSGSRSGHIYIEAGSWSIVPVGTTGQARLGHRSQTANNGLTAGQRFTMVGNGGDGTTSYLIDASLAPFIGAQDHLAAGGGATFAAYGDLTMDLPLSYSSAGDVNLLATGDLDVTQRLQNAGSGDVTAVAGWDGSTGMSPGHLDFLDQVPQRVFDVAAVLADASSWGGNGGVLTVGGGSQTSGVSVGSAHGATTALGHAVEVTGSGTAGGGHAQLGFGAVAGVSPTGSVAVRAKAGGVSVHGGDAGNAYAQIGHRNLGNLVAALSGSVSVLSGGDLNLRGGAGLQSSAQIGHGGSNAVSTSLGGAIEVRVSGEVEAAGGPGGAAYAQIGHGGFSTDGAMSGGVLVEAGGSVALRSPGPGNGAYAKIGHGDDLRGSFSSQGGGGTREGSVVVAAGRDVVLEGSLIGHRNSVSPATLGAGASTWIGVSRNDPADPGMGSLVADAGSELSGSEVRVYLPRRENNRVSAGVRINGQVYDGGVSDPWPVQRPDEYTVNRIDDETGLAVDPAPGEHDNSLGSGPSPVLGYAFYYDTIVSGESPVVPPVLPPVEPPVVPVVPLPPLVPVPPVGPVEPDYLSLLPDDRVYDDWLREQEEWYGGPGTTRVRYEGYRHYGPNGESVYRFDGLLGAGRVLSGDDGDEELLRRHLRQLEERAGDGEEGDEQP